MRTKKRRIDNLETDISNLKHKLSYLEIKLSYLEKFYTADIADLKKCIDLLLNKLKLKIEYRKAETVLIEDKNMRN
jgi:hypothetical protein